MHINPLYLLALLLLIGLTSQSQTVISGGYISGTWDVSGSPYMVQGTIEVHEDSTLLIQNGVEVIFEGPFQFIVRGYISAEGTITDSIHFHANEDYWLGISILSGNTSTDSLKFSYCSFSDGDAAFTAFGGGGAMNIYNTNGVSVQHCHFSGNNATSFGGAVYAYESGIKVSNSYFAGNTCGPDNGKAGAIYAVESEMHFEQTTFYGNQASVCGAFYADETNVIMDSCIFKWNLSEGGGGAMVCHNGGDLFLEYCRFENNTANGSGGALALLEGIQAEMERCHFFQNMSASNVYLADGGAVLITPYDNNVGFLNCKFSENYAEDFGGALYATSPTNVIGCLFVRNSMPCLQESRGGAITLGETSMRIINSTFVNNYALYASTIYAEDAELYMLNSIVWDEEPIEGPEIYLFTNVDPPLLFVDHCDLRGEQSSVGGSGAYMLHWGEGNIDADPHYLSPTYEYTLAWNSPCINAGRTDTVQLLISAEDFEGNPRIMGEEIDMGCYEYQAPIRIPEIEQDQDFLVYPNPAREYCFIKNNTKANFSGQVILSDLSGREVLDRRIIIGHLSSSRVSLSGIPQGMYILNIVSEQSRTIRKLLVTGY